MKIKDIALSAAYVGQMVVKAIAVGAQEVWSAVKYIIFKDPAVEQICVANFSSDGVVVTKDDVEKVTSIGNIFTGNTEITRFDEFAYFTSVTSVNENAFVDCSSLISIVFPQSVQTIGGGAVARTAIYRFTIPDSVTSLPQYLFVGCKNLTDVYFGKGVKNLGAQLFAETSHEVRIHAGLEQWINLSVGASSIRANVYLAEENITFPPTVTSLRENCFMSNKMLKSVIVDAMDTLGKDCFVQCVNLTSFVIRQELKHIGIGALAYTGLTEINLSGTISIGMRAFESCTYIKKISIGNKVERIDGYAFNSCRALRAVIISATTPPTAGDELLQNSSGAYIYVPDESVEAYKTASNWSTYTDRIEPMSKYVES